MHRQVGTHRADVSGHAVELLVKGEFFWHKEK